MGDVSNKQQNSVNQFKFKTMLAMKTNVIIQKIQCIIA